MRFSGAVATGCALIAVLLAACGGGGDGGSDSAGETSLEAEAAEFMFTPSEWTAAADTDVEMTLTNAGTTDHEWVIIKAGQELGSEADFTEDHVAFEVEAVSPEESGSGTFNLPAGSYQIICALDGHFTEGMEGNLTLE